MYYSHDDDDGNVADDYYDGDSIMLMLMLMIYVACFHSGATSHRWRGEAAADVGAADVSCGGEGVSSTFSGTLQDLFAGGSDVLQRGLCFLHASFAGLESSG